MEKIFLDTNIAYDSLSERKPFNIFSDKIIALADMGRIEIIVSSLTFSTINFLLSKEIGKISTIEKMKKFMVICEIVPFSGEIIGKSIISDFSDIEDAFQYYSALSCNASAIITRNKKDFKNSAIQLYTAEEYLYYLLIQK